MLRELMAMKAIELDMNMAFNLQLQEAINDSLFLSHQKQKQQQRFDFEISRSKTNNNKFVSEILRINDRDWGFTCDIFHKSYNFVSSSSSSSSNECFRMYFKGIIVDQIGNGLKKLRGIGVAICDSKDNVIFQLSKPLLEERNVRGEMVDIEALIEGLNAALALDLKRVVYYCGDSLLHQYVSGKRQPSERSISSLVKSVNLLHARFLYCRPKLVAKTDIKFAFKLARAAISAQLTRSAGRSGKDVIVACSICYEDTNAQLMFTVDGCRHQYCTFCMKKHVEVKLLQGDLPKCPSEGCKSKIKVDSCKKILKPKLLEIMSQRVKEATIPVSEKVYCPSPKCSALMSRSEIKECRKGSVVKREDLGASKCIKCQRLFCADCKAPWHSFMSCTAYRHAQSNSNNADAKLKSLATQKKWRQCPKCSNMVELAVGCYHITCRCGHEFCYTCGAKWKNKKPTCSCRIWDERNMIHDRDARQPRRAYRAFVQTVMRSCHYMQSYFGRLN